MPAYNFQKQFARAVETGFKCQTIRKPRKRPTLVGEELMLFTGQRGADCRLLCKAICTEVVPVEIHPTAIVVSGCILNMNEARAFAQADGFDRLDRFYDFFIETYGLGTTADSLSMELIKWKPIKAHLSA